jgi:hypothetical protein
VQKGEKINFTPCIHHPFVIDSTKMVVGSGGGLRVVIFYHDCLLVPENIPPATNSSQLGTTCKHKISAL